MFQTGVFGVFHNFPCLLLPLSQLYKIQLSWWGITLIYCLCSGVFKKGLANDQIILNICVLRGVSIFGMSHSYIRFWFLVVRTDSESIFHSKLSLIQNWLLIEWIERKEQFSAFCSSLCLRDINGAEQQSAVTNFNCLMFVLQC